MRNTFLASVTSARLLSRLDTPAVLRYLPLMIEKSFLVQKFAKLRLDKMVGGMFEKGLADLKTLVEQRKAA